MRALANLSALLAVSLVLFALGGCEARVETDENGGSVRIGEDKN